MDHARLLFTLLSYALIMVMTFGLLVSMLGQNLWLLFSVESLVLIWYSTFCLWLWPLCGGDDNNNMKVSPLLYTIMVSKHYIVFSRKQDGHDQHTPHNHHEKWDDDFVYEDRQFLQTKVIIFILSNIKNNQATPSNAKTFNVSHQHFH